MTLQEFLDKYRITKYKDNQAPYLEFLMAKFSVRSGILEKDLQLAKNKDVIYKEVVYKIVCNFVNEAREMKEDFEKIVLPKEG